MMWGYVSRNLHLCHSLQRTTHTTFQQACGTAWHAQPAFTSLVFPASPIVNGPRMLVRCLMYWHGCSMIQAQCRAHPGASGRCTVQPRHQAACRQTTTSARAAATTTITASGTPSSSGCPAPAASSAHGTPTPSCHSCTSWCWRAAAGGGGGGRLCQPAACAVLVNGLRSLYMQQVLGQARRVVRDAHNARCR